MSLQHHEIDGFGGVLRQWRKRRRISQLELSGIASTSARHISFLEQGRAKPSRNMVLKLAAAMDISPLDINFALSKAGFSTAFPTAELNDDSVKSLRRAVDSMLEKHMPWPALVVDQCWALLNTNAAADHLLQLLGSADQDNLVFALLSADDIDGPFINWPQVANLIRSRLDAQQLKHPKDEALKAMREKLNVHPRLQNYEPEESRELDVSVPIKLRIGDEELSLISMVAQFGAIQETTYSGVHIELFFPEDEATDQYFRCVAD